MARPDLRRFGFRRSLLLGLAGLALAVAVAEPRAVEAPPPDVPVKRVVLAIDVSASMQAEDALPTRLGRAVAVAHRLLDVLEDQEVGLLLYAGKAYSLAPPTYDHHVLRFLLEGLTPRIASAQDPGTLLSVGIREGVALLQGPLPPADTVDASGSEESIEPDVAEAGPRRPVREQVVVLIGDGDVGEPADSVEAAVEAARDAGVTVHAVGIGTEAGAGMLMPDGTYQLGGPVLDASGRPGISHLRASLLSDVADAGAGLYTLAAEDSDLEALEADLVDMGPAVEPDADGGPRTIWERYDVPFLLGALALVLVLLESLLGATLPKVRLARPREAT